MSWKQAGGRVVSSPPTASGSGSNSNDRRFKQNTGGLNAFQREQQFAAHYGRRDTQVEERGRTDWDVLKENHRFIRDDEDSGDVSWEERLARAYESKLFKEFALIDLKHYKSRRLALRWRTAEEVVEGLGEDTCASLRCKYHQTPTSSQVQIEGDRRERKRIKRIPKLRAFELPFVYVEMGERREALVKVRLCVRCEGKLTWKPDRERSHVKEEDVSDENEDESSEEERAARKEIRRDEGDTKRSRHRSKSPRRKSRSRSRSRSPRRDRHLI